MLSTAAPPMQNDTKPPPPPLLDYSSSFKSHPSRYSPPESPRTLPSFFFSNAAAAAAADGSMNNSHRGLPPLGGMSFPPPDNRSGANVPTLGHLPAPPPQWTGADESMRQWLQAKAEEDRRRQEEERTKQETLKLDQRKIEQTMLRESLQGGVPPPMVPLIFAGLGGGNLPGHTLEWAQHYLAQLSLQNQQQQQQIHAQQQQLEHIQQQSSPKLPRDPRMLSSNPYGPPATLSNPAPPPLSTTHSVVVAPPSSSSLARINTTDLPPTPLPPARQPLQPAHSAQPTPLEQTAAPGIFFHHWTPPTNNVPPTPSGRSVHGSPSTQHPASHLRSEYHTTPKKRKMTGGQQPSAPTSQPNEPTAPFSARSSRERETSPPARTKEDSRHHSRTRSTGSSKDFDVRPLPRPSSRQQRKDDLHDARR